MSENIANNSDNETVNLNNISKVGNVEVTLRAELGRTKLSLKDAIECDKGSIITLDRLNQEPIDVYVNDILIAKAQIVAIEDTYGIKITEIIDKESINPEKKRNGKIN